MKILLYVLPILFSYPVLADKMDLKTHDLLIEKLERGHETKSATISTEIDLRLADLYADRARLKNLKEIEKNCENCLKSKEDRQKAMAGYLKLFEKLKGEEQERVLVQIVHINGIIKGPISQDAFFRKIVDGKKYSSGLKARASIALAESNFYRGEFKKALALYTKAIQKKASLRTYLTRYRMAWCHLNLGHATRAKNEMIAILSNKNQLAKDPSLRADMARDLAAFMAKGKVGTAELQELHDLSPKEDARKNLELLASELTRLGKPRSTTLVSHYILTNFKTDELDKARIYIQVAHSEYKLGLKEKAGQTFDKSLKIYRDERCDSDEPKCVEVKDVSRKMIIGWNQDEKRKQTVQLVDMFGKYIKTFPEDYEISYWGGQAAEKTKQWTPAQANFLNTARVLKENKDKKKSELFNAALLSAIRVSEASKNVAKRREAYKAYLNWNPQGPIVFDARYQLAYLDYQEKKHKPAIKQFESLVYDFQKKAKGAKRDVAKKSADLILDIYALEKDNDKVMERSAIFAKVFIKDRVEYNGIYRKAVINQSNKTLANSKSSRKQLKKSFDLIKKVSFHKVSEKEQIAILESHNLLAEKLRDIPEVKRTARKLKGYSKATAKTKEFADKQLVWASEVVMDFSGAYGLTKKQLGKKRKSKKELLKLAMLAELSGRNPKSHYLEYLEQRTGVLEGNQIRAKIVRTSAYPWKEIKTHLGKLKRSPQLLSELALETHTKYRNTKAAELVLSQGSVAYKPAGKTLRRHLDIPIFKDLARKLSLHKMRSSSDRQIQKSISQRIEHLNALDQFTNKAIARKDWSMQLASLSVLERENARMYRELLALPTPRGLTPVERQQYRNLLAGQAVPYKIKSQQIAKNLTAMWQKQKYTDALATSRTEGALLAQKIIAAEAKFLFPYAPKKHQEQLRALAQPPIEKMSVLRQARQRAKSNPFSTSELENLKELEVFYGKSSHVAFVDERLNQLKKETR